MVPSAPWAVVVHIALPGSGPDLRYATPAVAAALGAAQARNVPRRMLGAWLVGGAHVIPMLAQTIGDRNVASTRTLLGAAGIPVVSADVGGSRSRTVVFDPVRGSTAIHQRPPLEEEVGSVSSPDAHPAARRQPVLRLSKREGPPFN
ncbi:MAG: hypothetical protein ACP5QO_06690 [Clostridia bacterium]